MEGASEYQIIYADPPWHYGRQQHSKTDNTGGAKTHYRTLKPTHLQNLGVALQPHLHENCLLFMWTTGPKMNEAVDTIQKWGFSYTTVAFVWNKQQVNPGYYTMSQCEYVLLGKHGKIPKPRGSRNERQFVSIERGEHSEKPDEVASRIENMFPSQNRLELFAREERPGWTVWGNEVGDPLGIGFDPERWDV